MQVEGQRVGAFQAVDEPAFRWREAHHRADSSWRSAFAAYRKLLAQSSHVKAYTYRAVQRDLYGDIVSQRLPAGEGPSPGLMSAAPLRQEK